MGGGGVNQNEHLGVLLKVVQSFGGFLDIPLT